MHKVINAGSALQTYALLTTVKNLGFKGEIIDYEYPNEYHRQLRKQNHINPILLLFLRIRYYLLYRKTKQKRKYEKFWADHYTLSSSYHTKEELMANPPAYDIYLTGSDQVWNPCNIGLDLSFFSCFSKTDNRISYASSFAVRDLPDEAKEAYANELRQFKAISVREQSGASLVRTICNKEAFVACDPTMLLHAEEYLELINGLPRSIKKRYVLVYALDYAFNPYPAIDQIAKKVQKALDVDIVYLLANSVDHYKLGRSITDAGPCNFLELIYHADFIVTSSFHGTAFSLIFRRPFISIAPPPSHNDERITSLLKNVGAEEQIVYNDGNLPEKLHLSVDYSHIEPRLESYINESKDYLKKALGLCQ